jgi:hypothetical protein
MVNEAWLELRDSRFPQLTFDCGNSATPGMIDSEHMRDWSRKGTTPDQRRIKDYIDRFDLRAKRILHIGIGNSSLAKRLHRRAREIVGTSVDEPEIRLARSLSLPNYTAVTHNKYSGLHDIVPGKFDFITDNNLTSPCCCTTHLATLFAFLDAKLADGGQIVTDAEGLGWVPDGIDPRWRFSFDDLAAAAAIVGFSTHRVNRNIYVLARSQPPMPRLLPLLRHCLRQTTFFPGEMIRTARRAISRVLSGLGSGKKPR